MMFLSPCKQALNKVQKSWLQIKSYWSNKVIFIEYIENGLRYI